MERREYQEKDGSISVEAKGRIILIDSSLLMYVIKGKKKLPINLEDALLSVSEGGELAVLDTTIEELELLRDKRKGKTRIAADFALEFIRRLNIRVIKADPRIIESVKKLGQKLRSYEVYDEILARMAEKIGAAVATTDMELVKKLRRRNIPCYFLSGRNWIKVSGFQY